MITVDNVLSATKNLSSLEPRRIVNGLWGDRTSYQLTYRDLNIVKYTSSFDNHLMEHIMTPMDEEYPFFFSQKDNSMLSKQLNR